MEIGKVLFELPKQQKGGVQFSLLVIMRIFYVFRMTSFTL